MLERIPCAFQRTESGLVTSPDPGLIFVNGMHEASCSCCIRLSSELDGVIGMNSHQLYQLNGTDGRTDDFWKAELGAEVTVTGVAFAILVALTVCQSVIRIS